MRLVLHIGLAKTGTTTQQRWLGSNAAELARRGVLFPSTDGRVSHRRLPYLGCDGDRPDDAWFELGLGHGPGAADRLAALRAATLDGLRAEIDAARPEVLLLSSEHLSARLDRPSEIARLAEALSSLGATRTQVIVCLRDQVTLLPSIHAEMVKNGLPLPLRIPGTLDPEAWEAERRRLNAASPMAYMEPIPGWLDYAALLDLWAGGFGREAIRVRLFEEAVRGAGPAADLLEAAGLPPLDGPPSGEEAASNVAPRAPALAAMRLRNRFRPRWRDGQPTKGWRKRPMQRLDRPWMPKFRLNTAQAASVRARYAEGNAQVARQWLGRDGPLFPSG